MPASDAYSCPKQESSTLEESHWQLLINKGECNLFRFGFLGVLFLFVCSLGCLGLVSDFLLLILVLVLILLAF